MASLRAAARTTWSSFLLLGAVAIGSVVLGGGCSIFDNGLCGPPRCDGHDIVTCHSQSSGCHEDGSCDHHSTYDTREACPAARPNCQQINEPNDVGVVCQSASLITSCKPASVDVGLVSDGTPTDLNGDGIADLYALSRAPATDENQLSVAMGRADGTYAPATTQPWGSLFGQVVADFDGDGNVDFMLGNIQDGSVYSLAFAKGHGDGTFDIPAVVTSAGNVSLENAVDVNGDGIADVIGQDGGIVTTVLGGAAGFVRVPKSYRLKGDCSSICMVSTVGDFDGDGRGDIVTASAIVTELLLGQKDGTFIAGPAFPAALPSFASPTAADLNGDGKLDLYANDRRGAISILLGHGDGTFDALTTDILPYVASDVVLADLDGDAALDLVAFDDSASVLAIRHGAGDGTFLATSFYEPEEYFELGATGNGFLTTPAGKRLTRGGDALLRDDNGLVRFSTTCK